MKLQHYRELLSTHSRESDMVIAAAGLAVIPSTWPAHHRSSLAEMLTRGAVDTMGEVDPQIVRWRGRIANELKIGSSMTSAQFGAAMTRLDEVDRLTRGAMLAEVDAAKSEPTSADSFSRQVVLQIPAPIINVAAPAVHVMPAAPVATQPINVTVGVPPEAIKIESTTHAHVSVEAKLPPAQPKTVEVSDGRGGKITGTIK